MRDEMLISAGEIVCIGSDRILFTVDKIRGDCVFILIDAPEAIEDNIHQMIATERKERLKKELID